MKVIVTDSAALVHMNPPKHSKTIGEYCESELGEKLKRVALSVNQLDLVFDMYREDSLTFETREVRWNTVCVFCENSTPIFSDFTTSMKLTLSW